MAGLYDNSFGDLGDIFGGRSAPRTSPAPAKEETGIPWEAKVIDGKYYVPLEQVGELLENNKVLPKVRAGIKRRTDAGPPK